MTTIYSMPGHLLRRMHQISSSVFAARMRAAGIDLTETQYATLAILQNHPSIDQATLAGYMAHDRPTMGGVIDRLAAKGLVDRDINPNDRRARILTLSPAGIDLLDRINPVIAELQTDILPGLTDVERKDFLRLAQKIADAGNTLSRAPRVEPARPVPTAGKAPGDG